MNILKIDTVLHWTLYPRCNHVKQGIYTGNVFGTSLPYQTSVLFWQAKSAQWLDNHSRSTDKGLNRTDVCPCNLLVAQDSLWSPLVGMCEKYVYGSNTWISMSMLRLANSFTSDQTSLYTVNHTLIYFVQDVLFSEDASRFIVRLCVKGPNVLNTVILSCYDMHFAKQSVVY